MTVKKAKLGPQEIYIIKLANENMDRVKDEFILARDSFYNVLDAYRSRLGIQDGVISVQSIDGEVWMLSDVDEEEDSSPVKD